MKKIIISFLLFSSVSYSQLNVGEEYYKIILKKDSSLSQEQSDFLKKVRLYYSDIIIPKSINNYYKNNNARTLKESIYLSRVQHDYNMYNLVIEPNNKKLHYSYVSSDLPDCGCTGDIYLIDDDVFRYQLNVCGKYKTSRFYVNGKIVYSNSPENEVEN